MNINCLICDRLNSMHSVYRIRSSSFRCVDSIDYKKAMLMFYEQNNIASFKQIFIDQFLFAVKTYF